MRRGAHPAFPGNEDVQSINPLVAETNDDDAWSKQTSDTVSPLFLAVIEATEEAIYNSLFKAAAITGKGHTVAALPLDRTLEILRNMV